MAQMTPYQKVQKLHGSKEELVAKIVDVIERGDESKDDVKQRLQGAANSKLLRLFDVASEIKDRFGSKEKLVDAILTARNRTKDGDYRTKLLTLAPGRLLDLYRVATRSARAKA
jgi:uncharacterized protein with von Willebrand factor type A (vWA) domain